jgi:hypothetical protein
VITVTDRRVVVVLGAHASPGPHVSPDDVSRSTTLAVLAIGWPLTQGQDRAVQTALATAREHGTVLDAMLVASAADAARSVEASDHVVIDGSGRERRAIRRALRARGISALDAR